jgi:hypothetical protein
MLIDLDFFMRRIGTKAERKHDRRFLFGLYRMKWQWMMKTAREAGDYATMDRLERDYEAVRAL